MTKERRLAIQMWEEIRALLPQWYIHDRYNLALALKVYKRKFCADYRLDWKYNCWFCQYMPVCEQCPLRSCNCNQYNPTTAWARIVAKKSVLVTRLEACDEIIRVLKGVSNDKRA